MHMYIYTTGQKFLNSKIFNVFFISFFFFLISLICSPSLHLFNPKYSKNSTILIIFLLFKITFLFEYILKCILFLWF